ncbi:hypothetical protein H7I77_19340 [Mycolicibacterium novocastrense]|uniref:Uncharacterized protein n=1 Tax=Mycolicibacterium novocastrense TaxID=59813 RepID=A0AAW5SMN5_MYCNV|nr:hypothetical protein [Mycolicibacterium novocastrense]MCV7025480.1 hypothetical protein [Mycolicibacterium novocastrense]GAT08964.1 uncharacterized protein RMCN_2097 [Mycolicibacterium novocastrense]
MSNYRLDVVSATVADAVRHAGGLMFDRVRAGWRVVVVTEDTSHSTALTILGTRTRSPGEPEEIPAKAGRVVHIRVLPGDSPSVNRRTTGVALPRAGLGSQLLFWGPRVDCEPAEPKYPVRHELSPAARRFKGCALHAAGLDTHVEPSEEFWSNDVVDADLFADLLLDSQIGTVESVARPSSASLVRG